MEKFNFVAEYEIKAAVKMLYPYVASASGLQEWFADEVNIASDNKLHITWDGEFHVVKVVAKRTNHSIKYQFIEEGDEEDPSFLEFKIDFNEMTQTSFLTVTDYSVMDDLEELQDLWEQLVMDLKEIMGTT
jgi:uncharacterized protein YndB with AHSA1/START domain